MATYPSYVKEVSKVKHLILAEYFWPWAKILASTNGRLGFIDCFAGKGIMKDKDGNLLPGSPIVALQTAKKLRRDGLQASFHLWFVEKSPAVIEELRSNLAAEGAIKGAVEYDTINARAEDFAEQLIARIKKMGPAVRLMPTFIFVDPFGYPISIPKMRDLLALGKTELLINIMSYRFHMDLKNPKAERTLDQFFGHQSWRIQPFMSLKGKERESALLEYILSEFGAKYGLPFQVPFSPEDEIASPDKRTKYYLLHLSSHPKAALLMKSVMSKARAFVDSLDYYPATKGNLSNQMIQPSLFDLLGDTEGDPISLEEEVADKLAAHFSGRSLTFEQVQIETLRWVYIEKEYRAGVNTLLDQGRARIDRNRPTKSGRLPRGVQDSDVITFL